MNAIANHPAVETRTRSRWTGLWEAAISLRCKSTVLVTAVTLSVTGAVTGYLVRESISTANQQLRQHLFELASMLSKAAGPLYSASDWDALSTLVRNTANGAPLQFVIVSDRAGRVLAGAHRDASLTRAFVESLQRAHAISAGEPFHWQFGQSAPVYLALTYPISGPVAPGASSDRALLGYVHTGVIADEWHRSILSSLDLVTGVLSLALVVAVPLGFAAVRRIVRPLEQLGDAMGSFSQGRLEVRSPLRRRDEIGRLVDAFNQMADEHQRTHERIVRLNAELESRVHQRTLQLRELATREPLTGLYNRRHFSEVLEQSFSQSLRYDNDLSCIMIDLDEFKRVNDRFGHQTGDQLLVLLARTITSQLRSADVAARFGGDEFVILLPQTSLPRARVLGERIVEAFAANVRKTEPHVTATLSVGIASLRWGKFVDTSGLLRAADRAMYLAKAGGKNLVSTCRELAETSTSREQADQVEPAPVEG